MNIMDDGRLYKSKNLEEPETNLNDKANPKTIDIYQHLKLNLKNKYQRCLCGIPPSLYCIPCKISLCPNCHMKEHNDHLMTTREYKDLTKSDLNKIFLEAEKCLTNSEIYINADTIKQNLIEKVNTFTNEMISIANKYKKTKIDELNDLFDNLTTFVNKTKEHIQATKKTLKNYHELTKKFFMIGQNSDDTNTIFLINYDMINIVYQKTRFIKGITNNLLFDYRNFELQEDKDRENMLLQIEKSLFDKIRDDNTKKHQWTVDNRYVPKYHFTYCCERLNEDHFNSIEQRVRKYLEKIDAFKAKVYDSYSKTHTFSEIEKYLAEFESSSKQKGSDHLFTRRSSSAMSARSTENTITTSRAMPKIKIEAKDDVCLFNPILKRYFSNVIIEIYDNTFRILSKELQSSHADLLIKVDPDVEETNYAKVHEGTNVVTIYDRKNQKMIKKKLALTKNPFGYTVFPIGCRHILLGEKLYITGGKDEKKEYATVIIYDVKSNSIKRIMDFREARSYHTLIYNDVFDTLMVFGGEMTYSVEIFDPTVNRWQLLPSLNYPRANTLFHFDKPRGLMYVMFGLEGKITEYKYSDTIEYLDLTQAKEGWVKLDYYNKAETNLKTLLNTFPLNSSYLLVYGGVNKRNTTKNICILNLEKGEIDKIDKELFEQLRVEAKNSNKLSSIVSSFGK